MNLSWVTRFCLLGIDFDTSLKNIIKINYRKKLTQIEKLLLHYTKLDLSLLGKITVIKTLAVPQLVYFLTVLPSPCESLFFQLDKLGDGSTKIKSAKMEKYIPGGGLKLTNIRFLHYGLKLSWIKRLISTDGSWQSLFMHIFNINKYRFWELDIQSITHYFSPGYKSFLERCYANLDRL